MDDSSIASQTDCTFVIDGKEVKAHKLMLSCCSPVFEKMFFGKLASSRVTITDIALPDFNQMLEFVYTSSVRIESVLHAWSLFYIAHKYSLSDFANVCTNYIEDNLTVNNLVLNYEYADMYGVDDLKKASTSDIADYARGIFSAHCDYHMKPASMLAILEQRALNISNDELVKAVLNWAVIECDLKNIAATPDNIVALLKCLKIYHLMTSIEFNVDPDADDLVFMTSQLIKNFKKPNMLNRTYLKKDWCKFSKCRQSYKIAGRVELRQTDSLVSYISVNRDTLLFGLVVATEEEQIGHYNTSQYNGMIQVDISEINNAESLVRTRYLCEFLQYQSSVYIPLSEVFHMESKKVYSVRIGYRNFDNNKGLSKSSVLCNYMSSRLVDEKKKIDFSFGELDGGVIRAISYYPA